MTDVRELIKERSHVHLIEWLRYGAMPRVGDDRLDVGDREAAADMAMLAYGRIAEILRQSLERRDERTFQDLTIAWRSTLDDEYRVADEENRQLLAPLRREQDRLTLGLVMWAVRLLDRVAVGEEDGALVTMFRLAAAQFDRPARVAHALAAADKNDEPWTSWILSELPTNQVHSITDRHELRRAVILLALRLGVNDPREMPVPRDELLYGAEELERHLGGVIEHAERWTTVLGLEGEPKVEPVPTEGSDLPSLERSSGVEALQARATQLRDALKEGRKLAELDRREEVRLAPLDEAKRTAFRSSVLEAHRKARVFGTLLATVGAMERVTESSDAPIPDRHMREWIPKEWLITATNVVGVESVGRDLGRVARREDFRQFFETLPDREPLIAHGAFPAFIDQVAETLRKDGFDPTLVVTPLNWRFTRQLVGEPPHDSAGNVLVASGERSEFEGVTSSGLAVLDHPEVPHDRCFVIDLKRVARLREWPSDDDSGARFSLRSFTEHEARELVLTRPEVRAEGETEDQTIEAILERLLLDLRLCWHIVSAEPAAAVAVYVPEDLRREHS